MKSSYKRSNLFSDNNKSFNFLPILTKRTKEIIEPRDFYYPINYELRNNNYGSVSFRSKTKRFENIKPTPHELDLEPYKSFSDNNIEHRVLNRPWLQQIQATLNDVFVNDHTNDGLINTSKVLNLLNDDNSNLNKSSLAILKSNRQINKNNVKNNSSNDNNTDYVKSNTVDSTTENDNKKYKNPYSECYFIKEPYKIITDDQPELTEEEEKYRKYMELFENDKLSTPYTTHDLESPEDFHVSKPNTSTITNTNNNDTNTSDDTINNHVDTNNNADESIKNNEPGPTKGSDNNEQELQNVPNEPINNNES